LPAAAAGSLLLLAAGASSLFVRRRRRTSAARIAELSLPSVAQILIEPTTSPEALRAAALDRAAKDPATAALVVRFWLGTRDSMEGKSQGP
jgi:hypothetical protein